jgi:Tol biopolymer transport system component
VNARQKTTRTAEETMTTRLWMLGATALILSLHVPPVAAQPRSAESLLQQGVNEELVAGDLAKASATYRGILVAHASNRAVSAQALANLGRAYEKLGASDARAAYQRLLREYGDQAEPVRFARGRLEALDAGRTVAERPVAASVYSMVFAELPGLRLGDAAQYDYSPSGDQIVVRMPADRNDSTLGAALVVVSSGGAVLRTLVPARREVGLNNPRWSPDGKYIAYREASWVGADSTFRSIRIIAAEGGEPRAIPTPYYGTTGARGGFFWTPDSRALSIAARNEIVTVDLAGTLVRKIPFDVGHLTQVTGYSPDGRWLAFHKVPEGTQQQEMDVWLQPAEGGRAIQLTNARTWDAWPTWAADGRGLYFVSNRGGSSNIWKLSVDPRSGAPQGEPMQITSYSDVAVRHPRMLQDGKLAFALIRQTGTVRLAPTSDPANARALARGTHPQLSPNGQTVYFVGQGVTPGGIFAVSTGETGVAPRRLTTSAPGGEQAFRSFSLSPDGRAIAYFSLSDGHNVLHVVETGGGASRELTRINSRDHLVPAWSPDGRQLAYASENGLHVIPVVPNSGEPRKLAQFHWLEGWTVRWSPDGQHVAALAYADSQSANAVVVVPASGGEARRLTPKEETGYKEMVEWHPDGTRLTYMYYGNDDRADETRVAYMDGRATTLLVDQPYPIWDYVGIWHPLGMDYYLIASTAGGWSLYAHNEPAGATRLVWDHAGTSPGAAPPAFSRDGKTMAWMTESTTRQLWVIDRIR